MVGGEGKNEDAWANSSQLGFAQLPECTDLHYMELIKEWGWLEYMASWVSSWVTDIYNSPELDSIQGMRPSP